MSFISKLADYLLGQEELKNTIVVFPGKRPILFLKDELSRKIKEKNDKAIILPRFTTLRDFVYSFTKFKQADILTLYFELYNAYIHINTNEKPHSFESFFAIADIILNDFNEIDHFLSDEKIFDENIEYEKIDELFKKNNIYKTYIGFTQNLKELYTNFKESLSKNNLAYDGMAYRDVVEKIRKNEIQVNNTDTYLFAGFNALTKAEKEIIKFFLNKNNSQIFWDIDEYYYKNEQHPAGRYIRENIKEFNREPLWIGDNLLSTSKKIHIIGCPLTLSQVKYSSQILDKLISNPEEVQSTVIVLPDETLLVPLIESLPEKVNNISIPINVTIGYKLKNSTIYDFINIFFDLYKNCKNNNNKIEFYYNDLINFFKHNCFEIAFPDIQTKSLIEKIIKNSLIFCSLDYLREELKSDLGLFDNEVSSEKVLDKCEKICNLLLSAYEEDLFNKTIVQNLKEVILSIMGYLSKTQLTINEISFLYSLIGGNTKIFFEGEPIEGLQVMGFLETRLLDFKNVVILNANEGFLPPSSKLNTLLYYEIRKKYGLPLYGYMDDIYSYYFYQLLQNAENVYILYNTEPDVISGKEKSRFIHQINYDLCEQTKNKWNITNEVLSINLGLSSQNDGNEKTEITFSTDLVLSKFKEGISYSDFITYLECPLKFYLKSILKLMPAEQIIDEDIQANVIGKIIHEVLKEIYQDFKNSNNIKELSKDEIEIQVNRAWSEHNAGALEGKNLIVFEIVKTIVANVLNSERELFENKKLEILALEKEYRKELSKQENIKIVLKGIIDRIDKIEEGGKETIRIIDYKTGKVELVPKELNANIDFDKCSKQTIQLLFYLLLYSVNGDNNISAGIYQLKKSKPEVVCLKTTEKSNLNDILNKFETFVSQKLIEIINKKTFELSKDGKNCTYCDYVSICNQLL